MNSFKDAKASLNKFIDWLRRTGVLATNPVDADGRHTWLGRVISALTFLAIIFFLALWITGFLLFQDSPIKGLVSNSIFEDLSCITFFGGLVIAIGIGAVIGNFLRRTFWKWLIRRKR